MEASSRSRLGFSKIHTDLNYFIPQTLYRTYPQKSGIFNYVPIGNYGKTTLLCRFHCPYIGLGLGDPSLISLSIIIGAKLSSTATNYSDDTVGHSNNTVQVGIFHTLFTPRRKLFLPRSVVVTRVCLLIGHDYLQKHLPRIGVKNSDCCPLSHKGKVDGNLLR
ncbi:hypothetical protein TNCV_1472431 [Trichonephila clavipes]|nr:hypothetical protein TNCV_1472431 [Trichonephila clavipes]